MRKLLFFFFLSCVSVSGQVVDANYGTNGKLFVNIPPNQNKEYNIKTFYTADQKTVNIGYYDTGSFTNKTYFITKYNYDGTPDAAFGTNGLVSMPVYPNNSGEITLQGSVTLDDNSIILSCYANMKNYLVKITGNGSIDPSFGINGFKLTDFLFSPGTPISGDLMKDDSNQVFAVYSSMAGGKTYRNFCKILSNGAIDTTFGNNGVSTILIDRDYKYQTLKQTRIKNGKIYHFATSFYYNTSGNYTQTDVWTCHFLNGTPDASFGDNGYVYVPRDITIYDYNIQEDGKILIANYVDVSSANSYVRGSRYLRSGIIDTSFGNAGKVEYGFGQWSVHVPHRIMEIDHHVYVFSSYYKSDSPVEYAATILKYNTNGVRDTSFGTGGLFKVPANISSVADVFVNGDKGFILTVQKNTYGELFNMKVDYNMDFLSTESAVMAPEMKLFPNPVTDILYMTGMKDDEFVIYNAAGQKVKAGSYTAGKGIYVQDLINGSYWLKLERSKAVQFIKK